MSMNRRNVLVGLGTIVAGGGAALGTGAFSSVSADRTVSIQVSDDTDALLAIEVNENYAGDNDVAEIDLTEFTEAEGLNINATTTFDGMVAITNQGTNNVGITGLSDSEITISDDGNDVTLDFTVNDNHAEIDESNFEDGGPAHTNISGEDLSGDDNNLASGAEESVVYDVTITTDGDISDGESVSEDITIEANEVEA